MEFDFWVRFSSFSADIVVNLEYKTCVDHCVGFVAFVILFLDRHIIYIDLLHFHGPVIAPSIGFELWTMKVQVLNLSSAVILYVNCKWFTFFTLNEVFI